MITSSFSYDTIFAIDDKLKKMFAFTNGTEKTVFLFRNGEKAFKKVLKLIANVVRFKKYRADIKLHIKRVIQHLNLVLSSFDKSQYLEFAENLFKNDIVSIIDSLFGMLESKEEVQLILFDADNYHQEKPSSLRHKSFKKWFDKKLLDSRYNYEIAFPNPCRKSPQVSFSQLSIRNLLI